MQRIEGKDDIIPMDEMDEGMFEIVDFVENAVDQIWGKYDTDNSGQLDEAETRKFINATLVQMKDFRTLEEDEFHTIFTKFDLDGNGVITKKEMTGFILSLAGFC